MHPDFSNPVAMLPMPRLESRTEAQAAGADCVWCGRSASLQLGLRISACQGALVQWRPRACRACVRREARRVHLIHTGTCPRCKSRDYCPDAKALQELSLPPSPVHPT
ncbi:hypothetical protein ACJWDR_37420 [Streptomyces tauricus]|uniref:hypothetical protein n=1 Tax=Streptomyces tauricus TaxID=68274 RepID=UPI00387EFE89